MELRSKIGFARLNRASPESDSGDKWPQQILPIFLNETAFVSGLSFDTKIISLYTFEILKSWGQPCGRLIDQRMSDQGTVAMTLVVLSLISMLVLVLFEFPCWFNFLFLVCSTP